MKIKIISAIALILTCVALSEESNPPLGSKENPVKCYMPDGEREYLNRLRDPQGQPVSFKRIGSFGHGPYGNMIDGYSVSDSTTNTTVFMDMYHSNYIETNAIPGFTIIESKVKVITPTDVGQFQKEAEKGDAQAQIDVGLAYYFGHGVPEDRIKALKWFHKAAKQNKADAQYFLGESYWMGYGCQKDREKAEKYYLLAAKQGHAKARDGLCRLYYISGPQQNYVKSYAWHSVSIVQEDGDVDRLSIHTRNMTEQQVDEAKKLAKKYIQLYAGDKQK